MISDISADDGLIPISIARGIEFVPYFKFVNRHSKWTATKQTWQKEIKIKRNVTAHITYFPSQTG